MALVDDEGKAAKTPRFGPLLLLVEDNPVNQDLIRRQIERLGYRCDVASSGRQALERLNEQEYRAVLTDLRMPDMDGFQLAGEIRRREVVTGGHLPIIAVSANQQDEFAPACGFDAYVPKPVATPVLAAQLKRVMGDHTSVRAQRIYRGADRESPRAPTGAAPAPVFDVRGLIDLVGDDRAVLESFLDQFLVHAAQASERIRVSLANGDTAPAADAAHQLKSSALGIGAIALSELCQTIETAADNGAGSQALVAIASRLAPTLASVEAAIAAWRA